MKQIIDVSSNNHPSTAPITWAAVANSNVNAVVIKCTQGTTYTNPWYVRDRDGARKAGLPVLAYHFATWSNPEAEANYFIQQAGKDVAAVLDIETSTDVTWSNAFLAVLNRGINRQMVYGSASSLSSVYGRFPATIWVAAYQPVAPVFGEMWQYTSSGAVPGIQGQVDISHWLGTTQQFDQMFHITTYTGGESMIASTVTGGGYWCVRPTGSVYAYGAAHYKGGANLGGDPANPSKADLGANDAIVGIAGHGNDGYWLLSAAGAVFAYGSATYHGGPNQH